MMRKFRIAQPQSRGERVAQHSYKVHAYHTHNVASKRKPGTLVDVRCTRQDCRGIDLRPNEFRITRPDGSVRTGTDSEYGR